jgi:hypothetical protein
MPNIFAYVMLLAWPVASFVMFKRMSRPAALIWTLLLAYLLLPAKTALDAPLLPPLNKDGSPVLAAFLFCLLGVGNTLTSKAAKMASLTEERPGWLPQSPMVRLLLAVLLLEPIVTGILNSDDVVYGPLTLPGITPYDSLSGVMKQGVMILPFLMGRKLLSTPQNVRLLLAAMVLSGLIYTIPALIEIRISPQLHSLVYGFFPHSFAQTSRYGGWRPQVFMVHGLHLALFFSMVFLSAVTLTRQNDLPTTRQRSKAQNGERTLDELGAGRPVFAAVWLGIILVLCKSTGALLSTVLVAPLVVFSSKRTQLIAAAMVAVIILIYPTIRGGNIIPTAKLVSVANFISEERAESLSDRFENEDILLEKARQRPFFGWGGWGRPLIYDVFEGGQVSTPDGLWIIIFGESGWIGYFSVFGLLTLPLFISLRHFNRPDLTWEVSGLCMILCLNLSDLLLNSGISPLTWLIAGAVLGNAERLTHVPAAAGFMQANGPSSRVLRRARLDPTPAPGPADGPTRPGLGGRPIKKGLRD